MYFGLLKKSNPYQTLVMEEEAWRDEIFSKISPFSCPPCPAPPAAASPPGSPPPPSAAAQLPPPAAQVPLPGSLAPSNSSRPSFKKEEVPKLRPTPRPSSQLSLPPLPTSSSHYSSSCPICCPTGPTYPFSSPGNPSPSPSSSTRPAPPLPDLPPIPVPPSP